MADAVIYNTKTGEVRSIVRYQGHNFEHIKRNKPISEGESMVDVTHLNLYALSDPRTAEMVQEWLRK